MRLPASFAAVPALVLACACSSTGAEAPPAEVRVEVSDFGKTARGEPVELYTLRGAGGIVAKVMTCGATLTELHVPDARGALADVVLGFDDLAGYESGANQYFGCTTGRVANRIARGTFELDGKVYTLAVNDPPNHLHGGVRALDKVVWKAKVLDEREEPAVRFTYHSPHGEEGYPGDLELEVTYSLSRDELRIAYRAEADQPTPVNLTHHSYFNLAGAGSRDVLDHTLWIAAARYTPTDETLIPTGAIAAVNGPLDFTRPRRIGERIAELDGTPARGYDHNFVLDGGGGSLERACRLADPASGRVMEIFTTKPGLQLYSGNFLAGQVGKGGLAYPHRGAVCLETQYFPDSINQPGFPSIVLAPGGVYEHVTVHRFRAE